ncbi:MAG TPA: V-type ATP synthase subunit D [Clostridiales bacterium]|nr:V-type ATP synthase subunit D [Clostridiales bacterium]
MAAVLPTKGNLMAAKRSRALAQTGYELMDRKRNILVREMMTLMDDAAAIQREIDQVFQSAYDALARANIELGLCDHIAEGVEPDESLDVRWRSVMGIELPSIPDNTPPLKPDYGFAYTSPALDLAYIRFAKVKDLTRRMAEVETSIYRLAEAIKKAQKRANALNNIVIPGFDHTIRFITEALEEKEREEFVRLKVIKRQGEKGKG